jgi:hypothetical protein
MSIDMAQVSARYFGADVAVWGLTFSNISPSILILIPVPEPTLEFDIGFPRSTGATIAEGQRPYAMV